MRWLGIKGWLMGCAIGTSCSLGGILFAPQRAPADPPAQKISLGKPVPIPLNNRGPVSGTLSPGTPQQPALIITRPATAVAAPIAVSVPQAGIAFDPAEQSAHQGNVLPHATKLPPGSVIHIHTEVLEPGAKPTYSPPANFDPVSSPETPAPVPPPTPAAGLGLPQLFPVTPEARSNLQGVFPRAEQGPHRKAYVDLSAAPCFARAPDYSWLIGQAEYSSVNKEWRLRYASVDEVDRFGGRVVLVENQHVGYLRDGMYVQIRGHLINGENAGNGPAFYRIESFQVVPNPNIPQPHPGTFTTPVPGNSAPATTPKTGTGLQTSPQQVNPNPPLMPPLPSAIPATPLPDALPVLPDALPVPANPG